MPEKNRTRKNTNRKVRRNTNRKVRRNTNRKVRRNTYRKVSRNTNHKVRRNTYRKGGGGGKQLSKLNNLHKRGGWPGQVRWNAMKDWYRNDARPWNRDRNRVDDFDDVTVSDWERERADDEYREREQHRMLTVNAAEEMKKVRRHIDYLLNDQSLDKPQEYFTIKDRIDSGETREQIKYTEMEKAMRRVLGDSEPSYFPPIIEHHYQLREKLSNSGMLPGTSSSGTDSPITPGSNTPSSSESYP